MGLTATTVGTSADIFPGTDMNANQTPSNQVGGPHMKLPLSSLLIVLVVFVGCATASKTNGLNLGMTRAQVLAVMGQPASTAADSDVEVLRYKLSATGHDAFHHRTEEYFVRLVSGKVERFGKAGDWGTGEGATRIPEQKQ